MCIRDSSKPAGQRIENVTFQGQPLTDDMTLTLCVNDYSYTGMKKEGIISGEKEWESSASVRDMLVAYLAEHDPLEPTVDNNWKITGVDLQKDNPERAAYIEKMCIRDSGRAGAPGNGRPGQREPSDDQRLFRHVRGSGTLLPHVL